MRFFHYNDEEKQLHAYLADRGHENVVLGADADPFELTSTEPFDAAFVGLHPYGLELVRFLHRRNEDCLVVIVTADGNARMAVEAMRLGAFDYLFTPLDFTEVERVVLMMTREYQNHQERKQLEGRLAKADSLAATTSETEEASIILPSGSLRDIVSRVEQHAIERALAKHGGNITRAAHDLGISRTTLYEKRRCFTHV